MAWFKSQILTSLLLFLTLGAANVATIRDPVSGLLRDINYSVDERGLAIYDGDIIWGTEAGLLAHSASITSLGAHRRYFRVNSELGWSDGVIRYKFADKEAESYHSAGVTEAIEDWLSGAPYLKFEKYPTSAEKLMDTATIYTVEGDISSASIAFSNITGEAKFMKFTHTCLLDPECKDTMPRHYRHELGHLLGLFHEQQRPDRNDHLEYHCENLIVTDECPKSTDCCAYKPTEKPTCCSTGAYDILTVDNFPELPVLSQTFYSKEFDKDSVMLYSGSQNAKPGTSVLFFKDTGDVVPLNKKISKGDFAGVCTIYKKLCDTWFGSER